jgi:N-acyl-D-aspartate/D-glutamate deacylase
MRRNKWLALPAVAAPLVASLALLSCAVAKRPSAPEPRFELVIAGGRVLDPESGLDAVRNVGLRGGRIQALSTEPLDGLDTLDASGLAIAPGFIDLHVHGQDDENYRVKAMDGVTTALELELGTADPEAWYEARAGRSRIHHGVSSGHIPARMAVFGDGGALLPIGDGSRGVAGPELIAQMQERLRAGLRQGALGVGMGIQYTPGASRQEVVEVFRVAKEFEAPVFVHVRSFGTQEPGSSVESVLEVIGASAVTGAPVHVVHLNSVSLESTPETLRLIAEARERGIDVTTEAYPYSAGMTRIESALLDRYEQAPAELYARMQWVSTGERLTQKSFRRYRREGGMVLLHLNTPEMEALAIKSPLTAIASDGQLEAGHGHPRQAGTYARVLGHYVRETGQISLMDAIRKMTLLPARRLERLAPAFRDKGRLREGADADLVVFDPAQVIDHATYASPAAFSEGFVHVLVAGIAVVRDGAPVEGVFPGTGLRAPRR